LRQLLWLTSLVLAVAVLATGCTVNSAGEPDIVLGEPTGTSEAQPAPSNTVAPTATPPPCTAPSASTPQPNEIEIIGTEEFKAWTMQALELIETRAPEAYAEVVRSLKVIESVTAGSGVNVAEGHYSVGDVTAHIPGFEDDQQLVWYAGTIVHDAHHADLCLRGEVYYGKEAEIACLTVQKAALELLSDDSFFANYVQGFIDGADDPANQYWNQPNRHW
jgi:hypothetical protein